jgi:uncharacterized heparinase superfamily protein
LPRKGDARIIRKALLIFHTLRYSRPQQIFYRLAGLLKNRLGLIHPPHPPYTLGGTLSPTVELLQHDNWNSRAELEKGDFCFLNRAHHLGRPVAWQAQDLPLLWQYNLHYFNYLFLLESPEQERLCLEWIEANPIARGVAWHPFPTSLRIVNWCKARFANRQLLESLYTQAAYLYRHKESHHPGNHVLENARALIYAGRFFAGHGEAQRWLAEGLRIYRREIPKQVLPDGGHFERSPMYHALILEGLLDILNLVPEEQDQGGLVEAAKRMSDFLLSVTHPTGEIALFNDATQEIAPQPAELLAYAQRLLGYRAEQLQAFADTGYFVHHRAEVFLIIDGGVIGPDFLPAHAHADIFSYELTVDGTPLVVDAGVFEYAAGARREYARSTRAHNTVCIDRTDQAECWGSFRVARRFAPFDVSFRKTGKQSRFQGTFAGYGKLLGDGIVHKRTVTCDDARREIVVTDLVEGVGEHVVESCIHLHPDVELQLAENRALVKAGQRQCVIESSAQPITVEDGFYSPEFGLQRQNKMLVIGGRLKLPATLEYRISY